MAEVVYALCAITSALCAFLLLRTWNRSGSRLLFWSGLCFLGLFANNVLLFVDLVVIGPETDLSLVRGLAALVAIGVLIYGLVREVA